MSKKIAKNRKHTTIAILTMAISSMSVFLAMPNSTANAQEVLRITEIEPQPITVGENISISGIIENPSQNENSPQIEVVKISSNCQDGIKKKASLSSNKWSANYTFWEPGECKIEAFGYPESNLYNHIATDFFNVEVFRIEQFGEILQEISSGKSIIIILSVVVSFFALITIVSVFRGRPNIEKLLKEINENVQQSPINLPPSIESKLNDIDTNVTSIMSKVNDIDTNIKNLPSSIESKLNDIDNNVKDIGIRQSSIIMFLSLLNAIREL